ncbi:ABC transporter A family member 2 isoform B [Micractinium conductrix]|uniref:ABC transporter A family member 2 isoform B n=1 Tax=Micractinium conductrix TaxID=554055 RepID=A0A2P6VIF8_9CHLO|nr:ABC transporter A family member 2 isoform B [Micractinium conductrix]|eukprot:PSC73883.1 ABC transporter A family member 2 isoform B [Micractinium conductrix]
MERPAVLSDAGGEAARELRCPALSFVRTVARSRFLRSALLSLELQESQPPVDGACTASTLEWTLAQLLALHLRAGEAEATGNSVAAALWVLESAHDAARSKATACLASWLEYLAVFAPEVVQAMMADWPASSAKLRRVVVEAQMRLLKALDWRLRLDLDTEVWPCLHLLFSLGAPAQQAQQQQRAQQQQQQQDDTAGPTTADGGSGDGAPAGLPPPSESWAAGMHAYCANIRLQATLIRQPPAAPEDATGPAALAAAAAGLGLGLSDAPAGSDPFPAAKRQRVAATMSFVLCVARSPVLKSALVSLEEAGAHPPAYGAAGRPAAQGLEWTLAQLLALHLRTGEAEVSGSTLLAALWHLQSAHLPAHSSPAACLADWLQHLAAFWIEMVEFIASKWPVSAVRTQQALEEAHARLLACIDSRAPLDFDAEVLPCFRHLFRPCPPPQQQRQQLLQQAVPASAVPAAGPAAEDFDDRPWVHGMHALCVLTRCCLAMQAKQQQQQQQRQRLEELTPKPQTPSPGTASPACGTSALTSSTRAIANGRSVVDAGLQRALAPRRRLPGPRRGSALGCRAAAAPTAPPPAADQEAPEKELSRSVNDDAGISMRVVRRGADASQSYVVEVTSHEPRPNAVLHWAVDDWVLPARELWPPGTNQAGDKAVQTPLGDGGTRLLFNFPAAACPQRLVFVIKDGEKWSNSGGGDFVAHLKPPNRNEVESKVLEAEATFSHWSLFNRFVMAAQMLDAADAAGPAGMGFFFTWLRLSTLRQLDWYRNSNYQSKDIAHVQKHLAERMAFKARTADEPLCRLFARLTLAGLPRGGGNGDDIRMGILHIMRNNGIKEGHRPGIEDHFLEQWHQKLHTNTTPEDVTICEAYLAFLHSGDMGDFWRVAWERGSLTPELLAGMDHPITGHPVHLPNLIDPFKHYLWILKTTHSGADLDTSYTMAKGLMDGELAWMIGDILNNRNEWWVPGKIVEARHRLKSYWQAEGASRDLLLLDIALDSYFRLCVERADKGAMSADDIIALTILVLDNASVSAESNELRQCLDLWRRVQEGGGGEWRGGVDGRGGERRLRLDLWRRVQEGGGERWGREWALLALAAADNTALCLENYCDGLYQLTQPCADSFADKCPSVDKQYTANFGEEVVRAQPVFMLSVLLRFLDPALRSAAGVGSWQVVSQGRGSAAGELVVMPDLAGIQGQRFDSPQVVVAEKLTGNEDIPDGIVAVLTSSTTDVLSHIAIRARAQGVLLATCFDAAELEGIQKQAGAHVSATVSPAGDVAVAAAEGPVGPTGAGGGGRAPPRMQLEQPRGRDGGAWVLPESEFGAGLVGGKSANLAELRGKLPAGVQAPASIALPFGTFERALAADCNQGVAAAVAREEGAAAAGAEGEQVPAALATLRHLIASDLAPPPGLAAELGAAAAQAGLIPSPSDWAEGSDGWQGAWGAICQVWASKWNDRAWLSRRTQGVPDKDLYMAVLLQQVVPAQYAFVLHTADPLTGKKGVLHGELVVGMGEALVGNYPGRALSFAAAAGEAPRLLSLPSKREGLFADGGAPHLIARSDSNGEDLEAFAGAGLYDSVPFPALNHRAVEYSGEPLLWDDGLRSKVLADLTQLGAGVEAAFGGVPQDIEGVRTADGEWFVVQSRPQVRKRPRLASGVALQWQQLGALLRKHTLVRQVLAGNTAANPAAMAGSTPVQFTGTVAPLAAAPIPALRQLPFSIQTNSSVQWFKGKYQDPNTYMQFVLLVHDVVAEKEGRARQMMEVMGLRPLPYWASWVVVQGLLAAVEACLLVGFGYAFGFRLFTANAFGLSFLLLLLVSLAMTSFSFFVSAFLGKASAAVPVGFMLFVVAWVILIVCAFGFPYNSAYSPAAIILFSVMPWALLSKGVGDLADASAGRNPGIPWADRVAYCQPDAVLRPGTELAGSYWQPNCVVPLGQMFWILAAVGFMALAIYLDAVLPDANGVRQPPWFFLLPSYWRHGGARASMRAASKALDRPTEAEEGLQADPDVAAEAALQRKRCAAYLARRGGTAALPHSASGMLPAQQAVATGSLPGTPGEAIPAGDVPADESLRKQGPQKFEKGGAKLQLVAAAGAPDGRPYAVELFGLRKVFKRGNPLRRRKPFIAVRGSWLGVHQGECFCLLGPNGAGKSTTINVLTGVQPFSGGDALVCGESIASGSGMDRVRPLMGVCPQFDVLWEQLTGREHLDVFGAIKGLPTAARRDEAARLLDDVRLTEAGSVRAGAYSGGMKRRLSVAIALLGDPQVVYLDEPTTGLDPISRRHLWELVHRCKAGRAIVLTTHSMEEADILGDRIGIMARGCLRCLGTSLRLKARFGSGYHVSIRMLAGEEAGAEGWAQAGGSSSSGSAGGGGFSAAMAVAMLAPSAYDNPLCEICPASPGEAPNGPAGPARRAGSSSSVGGASGRRRSPAAAKQAAAVRLLFRERLVVEPSDESAQYIHFTVPYEQEAALPALFSYIKANQAVLGVGDLQLRLTPLEEVFLNVARKAELEHAQLEGRHEALRIDEEGVTVKVPVGAEFIQSPAGHLYHVRWGQDPDSGELRLADYWRDEVSKALAAGSDADAASAGDSEPGSTGSGGSELSMSLVP